MHFSHEILIRLVGKDNKTPFVVVGHDTIDGKATDKKPGEW